jgi:hypothetical protein
MTLVLILDFATLAMLIQQTRQTPSPLLAALLRQSKQHTMPAAVPAGGTAGGNLRGHLHSP